MCVTRGRLFINDLPSVLQISQCPPIWMMSSFLLVNDLKVFINDLNNELAAVSVSINLKKLFLNASKTQPNILSNKSNIDISGLQIVLDCTSIFHNGAENVAVKFW